MAFNKDSSGRALTWINESASHYSREREGLEDIITRTDWEIEREREREEDGENTLMKEVKIRMRLCPRWVRSLLSAHIVVISCLLPTGTSADLSWLPIREMEEHWLGVYGEVFGLFTIFIDGTVERGQEMMTRRGENGIGKWRKLLLYHIQVSVITLASQNERFHWLNTYIYIYTHHTHTYI